MKNIFNQQHPMDKTPAQMLWEVATRFKQPATNLKG